jgi:hypothetical protein
VSLIDFAQGFIASDRAVVPPRAVPLLQNLGSDPRDGEGDWAHHGKPTEYQAAADRPHESKRCDARPERNTASVEDPMH